MYVLRKTLGPLSAGTPLEVLSIDTREWKKRGDVNVSGYATVRLANVSKELKQQIEHHPIYRQLLEYFDIEVDLLVKRRDRS